MRVFLGLLVGIAVGVAAVWYVNHNQHRSRFEAATDQIKSTAQSAGTAIEDKLRSLHLTGGDITNELARTGRVIRDKANAAGQAIADATSDARTTATIKGKFVREPEISAWDISVNTTGGVVTLAGAAPSAEAVGKAMALALDTDGVRQVVSTVQIKTNK
jgi:hyperosmotically inducible protein